jgi:DNA-binding NtrC family response regulator
MPTVLIVDDEAHLRRILSVILAEHGFDVLEAESGEQALEIRKEFKPNIALLDINLPRMNGLTTLKALLDESRDIDCIMITAHGSIRSAVEAIRMGAFDYLTKPFDNEELLLIINRALKLRSLSDEIEELRTDLFARYGFSDIVGISARMQRVFRTIAKAAPVDATVLIEGKSGTGKELVARAIHQRSHRAQGPFLAVNCGAVPHSLVEAEFFGYQRGAFTDAKEARAGFFEQAHGGTLFLDEIAELPLESQVKLLRVLQEHKVTRIGGRTPIEANVRVIAATNSDLRAAAESGRFREDLYWRLNVVKLNLPSLRERAEDIPLIIDHMLERFNREFGLAVKSIAPDARRLLQLYEWPGNVRELENAVCSAMVMCESDVVTVKDLPPRVLGDAAVEMLDAGSHARSSNLTSMPLGEAVKEVTERVEKMMILTRLAEMHNNRTATAESLGISRKTLFNKMRQYGLGSDDLESES